MSELEDRINQILGDPEQMKKITNIAQSLMGGEAAASGQENPLGALSELAKGMGGGGDSEPLIDPKLLGKISGLMGGPGGNDKDRGLLEAMKPYLSEKRRRKMDKALKLTKLAKVARLALGEMGEDGGV